MKNVKLTLALLLLFLTFKILSKTDDSKQINIVTSVNYLKDLIQNVTCSDKSLKVDILIPEGANPHTFHLDAKSKLLILNAKLLLLVHPDLENWTAKLKETPKYYLGKHLALKASDSHDCPHSHKDSAHHSEEAEHDSKKNSHSKMKDKKHSHENHHHHHNYDVHIWHSIELTQKSLELVLEELIKLQPEKKVAYTKCTKDSSLKIQALKEKLKLSLAPIPKEKRVIAIPHNSLNYLAEEFDIEIIPIFQNDHFNIAHPNELVNIIQGIKKKKIQALFYDDVSPKKTVDLISKEAKLKIAGTLATDSYSSLHHINDYLELWSYNIETIKKALK